MPRKKVSVSDGIDTATLGENEQIVIEDKKTIRKERSKPKPEEEPPPILGEVDFDDDDEESDSDFSETSIAALIYDGDGEPIENQFCTILVRRNPDRMQDQFATPCGSVMSLPPLANVEITAERYEIEERVRQEYGGGHYLFQIRFGNRLQRSWNSTLADLPATMHPKREPAAAATVEAPPPAAAPPVDPMDNMLSSIVKMKQLKDALFGDEEARLKEQIRDLKDEISRKPEPAPAEPMPDNLRILEKALGVQNPDLQSRLLDAAFPEESAGHWIPETVKTIFEHKEEIAGILGGILGGLAGAGRPAMPPANIQEMLRAQPPASLPAAPPIATTPPPELATPQPPTASTLKRRTRRSSEGENADESPRAEDGKPADTRENGNEPDSPSTTEKTDDGH